MSFVPVSGPATFAAAESPREGVVEFTGGGRTIAMPIRGALPLLTRAPARDDAHPSVRLLGGAALLGLRLVAAGSFQPAGTRWRPTPPAPADEDRVRRLAGDDPETERLVRDVVAAVVDAVPRTTPAPAAPTPARPAFRERLARRLAVHDTSELAQLVRLSLRIEADEEELRAGAVRVVPQVHDEQDPMRVCDAALLWTGEGLQQGFGERARTHAGIALRSAAESWPPLDRLLELRVPDQITLDGDELVSLLEDGVGALAARGVDVMWPRAASAATSPPPPSSTGVLAGGTREEPLQTGVLTQDALFAFDWRLRAARRPAHRGGDGPAPTPRPGAAAAWPVGGRRPGARPQGPQAADPHRHPGTGGGGRTLRDRRGRRHRRSQRGDRRREPAEAPPGEQLVGAAERPPLPAPPGWPRRCATTSATA